MKLLDKIRQSYSGKISDYSKIYTPTAEIIEQIADDYAIEFAEWLEDSIYKENNFIKMDVVKRIKYTTKELLEIYKKEKGL